MSRSVNQQLKLFYIADYLREESDANHPVSTACLIDMLKKHDIQAGRKTIYSDIRALRSYGMEIEFRKKSPAGFYLLSGLLSSDELKWLICVVKAGKFLPAAEAERLLKKVEKLTNRYFREQLDIPICVKDRAESLNEAVALSMEQIHEAIKVGRQLSFLLCEWTLTKELYAQEDRHTVTPRTVIWDDDFFYLIGYDHDNGRIGTFRLDKMLDLRMSELPACPDSVWEEFDAGIYSRKSFGEVFGYAEKVTLLCKNETIGAVLDRLGKDIILIKETNSMFKTSVSIPVGPGFFGWLTSFGGDVIISAPSNIAEEYKAFLKKTMSSVL